MAGAAGGNTAKRLRDDEEAPDPQWCRRVQRFCGKTACKRVRQLVWLPPVKKAPSRLFPSAKGEAFFGLSLSPLLRLAFLPFSFGERRSLPVCLSPFLDKPTDVLCVELPAEVPIRTQQTHVATKIALRSASVIAQNREKMGKHDGPPLDLIKTRDQVFVKGSQMQENTRMLVLYLLKNPGDRYARHMHERWQGQPIAIQGVSVLEYNADDMYELRRGGPFFVCAAFFGLLVYSALMFGTAR